MKVYVAPIGFTKDTDVSVRYNKMLAKAFDTWLLHLDNSLTYEITEKLFESDININWKRFDKKSYGCCFFQYDRNHKLYSAEISIAFQINSKKENMLPDSLIYHTMLHCIGIALGVPQTDNKTDIMCIPHQYAVSDLSPNDINAIREVYGLNIKDNYEKNIDVIKKTFEENDKGEEVITNDVSDEIRLQENNEIIKSLQKVRAIIIEKCARCKSKQGCMGCIFSKGEMRYNIEHSLELIRMLPHDKDLLK